MIFSSRRFFTLIALLLIGVIPPAAAQDLTLDENRLLRATVFVMQTRNVGERLLVTCVSSGTLVSRDGLILTNAHSTLPSTACPGETLVIGLSVNTDEAPVPRYRAELVAADSGLDLALLRITRQNDGRLLEAGSLSLPFVELADSDAVALDDTITVVGYPGIGDDPAQVVRGTVNGFAAEPSGGSKSWIKSSAAIPGTMSGGGAFDRDGRLIGVPTTAPVAALSPESRCVTLQDTNSDSLVNGSDLCIPVGAFINSLRPSNFARPLLRAASLGITLTSLSEPFIITTEAAQSVVARPALRRLFFSPAVNNAGQPSSVIRSLPTGSTSLYFFFDYENMTPETVYELRVSTNDIPNPTFSLSPVRWSGGRRGLWYVGGTGQPYPNGVYDFTLFVNGEAAESQRLLVGGAPEATPTFTDIVFGIADASGAVQGNGFVLGTDAIASARFIFRNMTDGTPWTAIWYYEGEEVNRTPEGTTWNDGANGAKTISIQDNGGLRAGTYRLELYIEGRLASTSDFTLAGRQDGAFARIFESARFTTATTPEEATSAAAISRFSEGEETIYALFNWQQIAPGTLWTMRWSVDGEPFYQQTIPWNNAESGENYIMRLASPGGVPDGTYRIDLLMNNLPFINAEARVGIGQLPIDRFAQASGVELRGQILDADTREGLPGATFILVSEEFSAADFTRDWRMDMVYAIAITDREGRFQLDRPLQPAVLYSVVIVADGYLPITADAVEVNLEDSPYEITIHMSRD